MFRLKKIHKYAGVISGIVLLLLSISGFFLNHDSWKFLYTTTFSNTMLPHATIEKDKKLYNTYYVDEENGTQKLFCGFRGVEIQENTQKNYHITLDIPCYEMVASSKAYFVATTEGIYISHDKGITWKPFALEDKVVTSLSADADKILAVIDKKKLLLLNQKGDIVDEAKVSFDKKELQHDISLGRFVRDVHYGRGLFDDGFSLLWNDFATLWLFLLASSGYLLWYAIGKIKKDKSYKKTISRLLKIHTSSWVLIAVIPLVLLVITGIFLDHSKFFAPFLHQTKVSYRLLPPVYRTLKEDIWSVDMKDGIYRIGNRYGVYKSEDLKIWHLENRGFAYKILHDNNTIYVSGMGASNRIYKNNSWKALEHTPHMFKSIYTESGQKKYFYSLSKVTIPKHHHTTLYSVLLSIHDGSFFAPWWVFINDIASILLLVLLFTGLRLWYRHVRKLFR
ncbi:MAG: PepSY domain-containing protein [Sulfurovum sp.]|nr:PepSY domain-containing protein [Sulfurovum sp.]